MSSANVTVSGRLASEPEMKTSNSGTPYITLSIPVKQGYGDKERPSNWYRIKIFGKRAESIARLNLTKGTKITASGALEATAYTNSKGELVPGLDVIANDLDIEFDKREQPQF